MSISKVPKALLLGFFLSVLFCPKSLAADVKMRIVVINPSVDKVQTKSIKNFLPKEIAAKDVKDTGGLELDYDNEQGMFYVYKNDIPLEPGETKSYEVLMDDVWMVPDQRLDTLHKRVEKVIEKLRDTPYFEQAELIANTIYGRLDDIAKTQNDLNVSRQQHIAYYRDNLKTIDAVMQDIDRIEKLLVAVGGPPNLELMEQSDVNLKAPSSKTTWVIIFIILIFIMILGGAFYFTWQGQAKVTENIFTKEKADSFSEFKPSTPPNDNKKPG